MLHEFCVTKYDPQFRDAQGRYTVDEWTCPSEIGKTFNGRQFTREEYLEVESKYISAVLHFFSSSRLPHLRQVNVGLPSCEMGPGRQRSVSGMTDEKIGDPLPDVLLGEDLIVEQGQIRSLLKLDLRNHGWCDLEYADKFYVTFGYDYYMWIGTAVDPVSSLDHVKSLGLFAIPGRPSLRGTGPYRITYARRRKWLGLRKNPYIDGYSADFELPPQRVREIFGLSDEHPGTPRCFPVYRHQARDLGQYVSLRFNFLLNTYQLCNQG